MYVVLARVALALAVGVIGAIAITYKESNRQYSYDYERRQWKTSGNRSTNDTRNSHPVNKRPPMTASQKEESKKIVREFFLGLKEFEKCVIKEFDNWTSTHRQNMKLKLDEIFDRMLSFNIVEEDYDRIKAAKEKWSTFFANESRIKDEFDDEFNNLEGSLYGD